MDEPQDSAVGRENHCPFGCQLHELEENSICPHYVGTTDDGKLFEPLVPILRADGEKTGRYRTLGGKKHLRPVEKNDVLVNPTMRQLVDGVWKVAKRWVSSRVYREAAKAKAS